MGTKIPGTGAIYVSQTINFRAPLYVGDAMTATATVVAADIKCVSTCVLDFRYSPFEKVASAGARVCCIRWTRNATMRMARCSWTAWLSAWYGKRRRRQMRYSYCCTRIVIILTC